MKKLFAWACLLFAITAHAQKQKTESYIENYRELAIAEMMRTGVPAAITLAQGILESQSGESDLVKVSNNHFGIKCKTEWTGEKTYHDDDAKGECFRVYPSAGESFRDHSDFLKSRPHYAFLFKLDPTDFEGWAKGLKKAGYATSPTYPQKLLKLINEYHLQQYTLDAIARMNNPATAAPATTAVALNTEAKPAAATTTTSAVAAEPSPAEANTTGEVVAVVTPANTVAVIKKTAYPAGIFTINHSKVTYAAAGTSLLSLADKFDLPLGKLVEYNDLKEMDVLDTDRLIFIEKKQKRGSTDFHTVAEGETLHDICQLEGVRLESLLEYNNLAKDATVLKGDKIYLRTVTPTTTTKAATRTARKTSGS